MQRFPITLLLALSAASLGACGGGDDGETANGTAAAPTEEAREAAGEQTIAAGIPADSQFASAAQAAGLDQTLAGPGPYTVLVPSDAAFAQLPAETTQNWSNPEARGELTQILTYHILPGVVLAEDIGKAVDNGGGQTVLATMGGGTINAAREGGNIVLTDSSGSKATLANADQKFSNGVVHQLDAVLMPSQE